MFCPVYKPQMLALRNGGLWILIQKITWRTNNTNDIFNGNLIQNKTI